MDGIAECLVRVFGPGVVLLWLIEVDEEGAGRKLRGGEGRGT